jgi:thiamine pyrophosphokinase
VGVKLKATTLVKEFPVAKDHTDLQLLLAGIAAGPVVYLCSGVWGGRFDHLYSAVHSLAEVVAAKTAAFSGGRRAGINGSAPGRENLCFYPAAGRTAAGRFRVTTVSGSCKLQPGRGPLAFGACGA